MTRRVSPIQTCAPIARRATVRAMNATVSCTGEKRIQMTAVPMIIGITTICLPAGSGGRD
jgi:hypothetical protein